MHVARLNHAMNSGDEITASDVEWVSVPHSLLPNHAITQENHVIGKHLIGDADDGEAGRRPAGSGVRGALIADRVPAIKARPFVLSLSKHCPS